MSRIYRRKDIKDNTVWWARFKDQSGTWHRRSTGLTDHKAAQQWVAQREREAVSPNRARQSKSLSEALTLIEASHAIGDATKRMYAHRGAQIIETLGDVDLFALTREDVQRHIGIRLGKGRSRNTVHKELLTIRKCLGAVEGPLDCLRKLDFKFRYKPKTRHLSFPEFIALTLRLERRHKLWVTLACYTGGRRSEVDRMLCEDIDFERGAVHIRGTKTSEADRTVPLHPALRQVLLIEGIDKRKGLIVGTWGKVNRDLAAACDRAQIDKVGPNDLRRSYCSWMMQAGLSASVVRRLMGHASTKMIDMVYGQIDWKTLEGAVGMLPWKGEST